MANPFLLSIFIICLRESLEASVIVSVLLSFVKQSFGGEGQDKRAYKRLLWHVWLGTALGFFVCLCVGCGFIGAFYALKNDIWSAKEDLWEGVLCVIASIMITAMGLGMIRVEKMKDKWRVKISQVILEGGLDDKEKATGRFAWIKNFDYKAYNPLQFRFSKLGRWTRKYAMFLLPFITVLREGVEAIVFVGGVSIGNDAASYPLSVVLGLLCGCGVGYLLYLGGALASLRWFMIFSTCLLYLISAGLFSRSVWYFQMYVFSQQTGGDVAESGSGPGSYNIKQIVWHVNCCNPELNNNGWGIFNALFGWQNSATYGSVLSYNAYWIFIMIVIACMIYEEKTGSLPIIGRFWKRKQVSKQEADELYQKAQQRAREHIGAGNGDAEDGMGIVEEKTSNGLDNSIASNSEGEAKKKAALAEEQSVSSSQDYVESPVAPTKAA